MTIDSSHRYAAASVGVAVSALSLVSVNYEEEMIKKVSAFSGQTQAAMSSIAGGIFGALSQNSAAVIGVASGGFLVLQAFSKPSKIPQNLAISAIASTCLVALAKSSVDPLALGVCLMPVALGLGIYMKGAYYNNLIADAETGNEEAIVKLCQLGSFNYFKNEASETAKKRLGKALINFAEKLYAKGDQKSKDEALVILSSCFFGGFSVTQSNNAAMLCMQRVIAREGLECIAAYNANYWNECIKQDPTIEALINDYLGIKEKTTRLA